MQPGRFDFYGDKTVQTLIRALPPLAIACLALAGCTTANGPKPTSLMPTIAATEPATATTAATTLVGYAPLPGADIDLALAAAEEEGKSTSAGRCSGRSALGRASYYGPGFHGRRTANGERFNQNAMTAAHKTYPFGTKVRVTNLNSCRSIVVRINDRGPFVKGRVIDLSQAAAYEIGMRQTGTAPVAIERIN